ncbi:MAG: Ig-like domain-containing protein [Clostridia bacterium]|nr:Ig-like domain-containing protein [Clostridia bacterium]
MKKLLGLALALLMLLSALPSAGGETGEEAKLINTGVTIDTDPAGGYAGDYVVIYNPSADTATAASTGSLAGLIETDVNANILPSRGADAFEPTNPDIPYIIDVDHEVSLFKPDAPAPEKGAERAAYPVGSTHTFNIYNYSPTGTSDSSVEFKVIYVGQHCTIWTVTNSDYHPLDGIDSSYGRIAAERFDEKFELMQASYGDFNDVNGDGKVNLLFYNIDDGWQPGQGYVAGYFWSEDFNYNSLPMIHIDTWPGIQYTNAAGVTIDHFDDCFGTLVHEFQHCINFSETGGMNVWLNEALSGSAEELCFPGSGLYERIPSWHNYKLSAQELTNPPVEYAYNPDFDLHKGGSLTAWDSSQLDIYARYAEVMLFTQYLYTATGSTSVYKQIIEANSGDTVQNSLDALTAATGMTLEQIWGGFFTSMIANDPASGYGFLMNEGYDPSAYYGLESLYSLLSPVVYTSTDAAEIYGGGFITVRPVNGVFNPPAGASSALRYVGVTVGEVTLDGFSITPDSAQLLLDETAKLVVVRDPIGANNYDMVWTSSDESVATVSGNRFAATVESHAPGSAVITATATDRDTGAVLSSSATVTVLNGFHYTKYVPTDTIETGVEYLIGSENGGEVYVLMNYNPNPLGTYVQNPYYVSYSTCYYSYGIKAVVDDEGAITDIDTSVYPDAVMKNTEWLFYEQNGYYIIRSAYNRNYHLRVSAWQNSFDLYPENGSSYSTNWLWDEQTHQLSYDYSKGTRYVTFVPTAGDYSNLFNAPKTAASVQLYKKVTGVQMNDDVTYYTVTFVDWNGAVLSTQHIPEGGAATAPADPVRAGWTFIGWDVDFSNVTGDLTVTAQYEENPPAGLIGDIDLNGVVNTTDALLALRHSMNIIALEGQGLLNGDVNGDGVVNATDAVLIMRIALNVS